MQLYAITGGVAGNTAVRNSVASNAEIRHIITDYTTETGKITVKPCMGFQLSVPTGGRIKFETGALYVQKGFNGYISELYGSYLKEYISRGTFHYINVPLLLSYDVLKTKNGILNIAAGINYGFFLNGRINTKQVESIPGQVLYNEEETRSIMSVVTNARYLKSQDHRYMELLDVMYRIQIRYNSGRYAAGLFFDNSPKGITAQIYNHRYKHFRQPCLGLFVGLKLNG